LEWSTYKTKLPHKSRREIKRVATDEDEAVVTIPEVVRVTVVATQPATIVVVFNVEHLEVAVRVRDV